MKQSKISNKLALYFFISLISLSLILVVVFSILFKENSISIERNIMKERAQVISKSIGPILENDSQVNNNKSGLGQGQGQGSGFGAYLRFINDIAMSDVWLIDSEKQLISKRNSGEEYQDVDYKDIPVEAMKVVDQILKQEVVSTESFSSYLQEETLSVGAPILNSDNKVIGAVVLHKSISGIQQANQSSIMVLVISVTLSLVISLVLSFILSNKFTKPIKKLSEHTKNLTKENYSEKNDIVQNDEIGLLASDINQLAQYLYEARLADEKLEKARQDFIANITHELKTPVTIIKSKLEAINDDVLDSEKQKEDYLNEIKNELDMLDKLIYDLLELAKLQSEEFSIKKENVIVNDVVNELIRSFSSLAKTKNIDFNKEFDDELVVIEADYFRLRQLFQIIIDNALKFSNENSKIDIVLKQDYISIIDYGNKLNTEEIPYLFDRFYLSKNSLNGNGLGLTIAKEIIEKHGFRIEITQDNNTNFTIYFK